ncbi:MAG TPA: amino acid permease [Terriglobales bacterium]|nr:amino acid permease [Terriglobales bacterium]
MGTKSLIAPVVEQGLRRQLGLASATAAVAGEAIAVGIFLTPAEMAKSLGSPFWLLLVWLIVAGMTLSGALCYGELAGRFPRAGGTYVYLQETFGRRVAFLYGWMCLLVLDPGLTAALATGVAGYAAYIFHWSALAIKFAAIIIIFVLCLLNALSMRISAGFLRWITWLKLGLLGLLIVWALAFHLGSWTNFVPFIAQRSGSLPLLPALGAAMVGAFFSFGGWWDVSKIAGEVRDTVRTLPRAMVLGVLVVTAVYILVSAVFLYLIPLQNVTSNDTFVAQVGEVLFGSIGGIIFAGIVIVCVLGGLTAFVISAPRVYFAMAKDGLFLAPVARVHPRFGTPVNAILIQAFVASLLIFLGTFQQILSYFIFIAVAFLGLTVAGLFVVRSRKQEASDAILALGYPVTPMLFVSLVLLLLVLLLAHGAREPLLGTAVVLVGLPVYSLFQRRTADTQASLDKAKSA